MHRKDQLHKNIQDWLDLDLPETCTSMDQFNSLNVKRVGMRVEFNQKIRGNTNFLGLAMLNPDGTLNGVIIPGLSTPIMSLILFGLEKAVETN
jgi:hypothetical protein